MLDVGIVDVAGVGPSPMDDRLGGAELLRWELGPVGRHLAGDEWGEGSKVVNFGP